MSDTVQIRLTGSAVQRLERSAEGGDIYFALDESPPAGSLKTADKAGAVPPPKENLAWWDSPEIRHLEEPLKD